MDNNPYRFSYVPQYADLLYVAVFLLGGSTIALLKFPFFIPIAWIVSFSVLYLFVARRPRSSFFENTLELVTGFGPRKHRVVLDYAAIKQVEYCFTEVRGPNIFKLSYVQNDKGRTLQYSFYGRPSSFEVSFFQRKGISIKVSPEKMRYKLDPS